ncbi:MAG: sulfotransferase [Singulisphaera sp.]|nr:sulfotransferase [Singulisphaera sp.]
MDRPDRVATPWAEKVRVWLFKTLFTPLCGVTFHDWCRVLRENHFAVDLPYWPRAAALTAGCWLNSVYLRREMKEFGHLLEQVAVPPPLFILGHWRSGTTLLQNLLALDDRFAYPNLYEVFFPHTFLTTEDFRSEQVAPLIPSTRVMDNVAQGVQMPNEDEFATSTMSLRSPYMMWAFPRQAARYERYLTFRDVPEADIAHWKEAFVLFVKKLTIRHQRPLVLKSPPHTCRIKLLLGLFPDARFVHIRRDPYTIFQSTKHLNAVLTSSLQFQRQDPNDLDAAVLRRYRIMYDAYFEERDLIPEPHLHELAFEDLERDPIGQTRRMYEALGLPSFDAVFPRLREYVGSLACYRKNEYPDLPPGLRGQIRDAWWRNFEAWGYPLD